MRLLLDTHVFLWWALTPERLPGPVMAACTDPATTLLFSTASVWEIQIKAGLGKLTLHQPLTRW
jgi:PIN domain nuclease of toxin-antitoxin system